MILICLANYKFFSGAFIQGFVQHGATNKDDKQRTHFGIHSVEVRKQILSITLNQENTLQLFIGNRTSTSNIFPRITTWENPDKQQKCGR
jgi:hypothetical protein